MHTPGFLRAALAIACAGSLMSAAAAADATTPEQAIQSWWQVKDEENQAQVAACEGERGALLRRYTDRLAGMAAGPVKATMSEMFRHCSRTLYQRRIDKVQQDGATAATVYATIHNVTPIPAGAQPPAYAVESRTQGQRYKYELTKANGRWLLAQVYEHRDFASPDVPEWEAVYNEPPSAQYPSSAIYTQN